MSDHDGTWLWERWIDLWNGDLALAEEINATAFDMIGAELSHHGGDCSFETFLKHYQLEDPVLWGIARIVHEADLADERYDAPEAPGFDVALRGLSMVSDDHQVLELTGPLFDGLYEYLKRAAILDRKPSD